MNMELSKIIRFFITFAKLSNFDYIPTRTRLSSVTLPEYSQNEELRMLFNSRAISDVINKCEIYGAARPSDLVKFLQVYEGRAIIKYIVEHSSFMNTGNNADSLIDEVLDDLQNIV